MLPDTEDDRIFIPLDKTLKRDGWTDRQIGRGYIQRSALRAVRTRCKNTFNIKEWAELSRRWSCDTLIANDATLDSRTCDDRIFPQTFLPRCMECRRGLTMRILSVRLSVPVSVRPSVKRVHCDKTEERSVQIFTPCERSFILVFWEEELLVGDIPFYPKFWVNRDRPPLERNRRFWTNNRS